MPETFAEWYAENTDADYDTIVKKVEWYLLQCYDETYKEAYHNGFYDGSYKK